MTGEYDELTLVKQRKLRWFRHVSRSSGVAKTILQGIVKVKTEEVDRRSNGKTILEWTEMDFSSSVIGQLKTG